MDTSQTNSEREMYHARMLNDLGCSQYLRGELASAERSFREALDYALGWPSAMSNLGLALLGQQRYAEAESILRRALELSPDDAFTHNSMGRLLRDIRRLEEAEIHYRNAIRLDSRFHAAHNNLGLLLLEFERIVEAETAFRSALAIDPTSVKVYNNLGNALYRQVRIADAIEAYRCAIALRPDYAPAKANLAAALLLSGEYAEGWALYESRYDPKLGTHFVNQNPAPWPMWEGESLCGKSLLVWPEQGFGDTLQFCRYISMLKGRGVERLSLACMPELASLLESLGGVDAIYPLNGKSRIPPHDYWCFVMSLPHRFGTTVETIPTAVPYLHLANGAVSAWQARLPRGHFRVGLVWAGDPRLHTAESNVMDRRRSVTAQTFLPILRVPGVTFVSLQMGETTRPQLYDLPLELRPYDPMADVGDFADTAAIIQSLDLVITVDTSVAHLAGALNKPTWLLSRYDSCWRWLRERSDSPWYPSMRLFRQKEPGNWTELVDRVAHALKEQVKR